MDIGCPENVVCWGECFQVWFHILLSWCGCFNMSLFSQVLGQDSHFDKHVLQIVGWNHHLKYIYTIALKARKQKHRWVTYESRNTPIFMCKVFQMKDSSSKVWIHLAGSFNQAVDASTSCYLLSLKYQKTSKVIVYQES